MASKTNIIRTNVVPYNYRKTTDLILNKKVLVRHLSLHLILSAEGAVVFTVLRDFHLLDSLPQAGTITGTVLPGDSNLLGSLSHHALYVFLLKSMKLTLKRHVIEKSIIFRRI